MNLKSLKKNFSLLIILTSGLTLFFSCQKQTIELEEKKSDNSTNLISANNDPKGYANFLNIQGLDTKLKNSIIKTDYRYYRKETNQLWIMALKPGTYGFENAKIAVNLIDGQFSMIFVSYSYDTVLYRKGNFNTYTGTISVYDQKLKKIKDFVYENGKSKKSKTSDCTTCISGTVPSSGYTDWCLVYPPFCANYILVLGYEGHNENPNTFLDMPGGGGGGGTSFELSKDPYEDFDNDINNNVSGGFDNTIIEEYKQTVSWPLISNVIPKYNFVGWGAYGIPINCMDYAKAQIGMNGYQISNYGDFGQTFQVFTLSGANQTIAKNAVSYLLYALKKGIPVIVGIDNHSGTSNPQTDNITDHFVVIVGSGSDTNGNFFRFYDNASSFSSNGANDSNKLYYDALTGLISGKSQTSYSRSSGFHDYIVTQVRKSKLR